MKNFSVFLIFYLLLISTSCNKSESTLQPSDYNTSISQAISWYGKNIEYLNKGSRSDDKFFQDRHIDWESATEITNKKGNMGVIAPVKYPLANNLRIKLKNDDGKIVELPFIQKAAFFKNGSVSQVMLINYVDFNGNYNWRHFQEFDGWIIRSTWHGVAIYAERWKNGKLIDSLRPENSIPGGRTSSCSAIDMGYDYAYVDYQGTFTIAHHSIWMWVNCEGAYPYDVDDNSPEVTGIGGNGGPVAYYEVFSNSFDLVDLDWQDLESPCNITYNGRTGLSKADLFMDILMKNTMNQLGITDAAAALGILSGANVISTRTKFGLTTSGTSIASKYISNLIPWKSARPLPTLTGFPFVGTGVKLAYTRSVGRFIGRTIPVLGWGMAAYDIYSILDATVSEYNFALESNGCN